MRTEAAIADTLQWWLSQLVLTPALPVAMDGVPFDPAGGSYLEATFLPNRQTAVSIPFDDAVLHQGLFQVTVVARNTLGVIGPIETGAAVIDWFNRGTVIQRGSGPRVSIVEQPWQAAPLQDSQDIRVPVTIPWVVYP